MIEQGDREQKEVAEKSDFEVTPISEKGKKKREKYYDDELAASLDQGAHKLISVTVVMRSAESLPERSRKSAQLAVERLKSQNCSLIFQSDIHQKYAIIDDRIVWYGSINLLSFGSSQESMMRLISGSIAHELMKTEAFNENH